MNPAFHCCQYSIPHGHGNGTLSSAYSMVGLYQLILSNLPIPKTYEPHSQVYYSNDTTSWSQFSVLVTHSIALTQYPARHNLKQEYSLWLMVRRALSILAVKEWQLKQQCLWQGDRDVVRHQHWHLKEVRDQKPFSIWVYVTNRACSRKLCTVEM